MLHVYKKNYTGLKIPSLLLKTLNDYKTKTMEIGLNAFRFFKTCVIVNMHSTSDGSNMYLYTC